jgi:hypothetical protein
MLAIRQVGRRHAVAILWGILMSGETNATPPRLELRPLPVPDAATIVALALVADPAPELVLAHDLVPSGRRLVAMRLAGGAPIQLAVFPHRAAWSAAPAGAGQLQVAATDNGSAGSGLTWKGPAARRAVISQHERHGVFDSPAFLRPTNATPEAVAAAGLLGGRMCPVLFQPESGDHFAAVRPLPLPRPGTTLAVKLLHIGQGFLQATLMFQRGSAPRPRTDNPADGLIQGGLLECQRLTSDLQPAGQPWRPFEGETVWQFDADVVGDRPVLLASVADGLALAAEVASRPAPLLLRGSFPTQLLSPALVAEGTLLHIAALTACGTPQAAVLVGQVPLS